ncbi:electron transfer flavoprotein subunit alpha [uncultured Sphaerochaeta sp.]|uniref:electron transfer flavoprotein subunit alpha n=1 Tax=uncultured Sphaerochaeta sp. TaxID=886478 RepID=UPI002A0A25DF|nr:electron transfer flavoprotein subunit alpha [uncultured Sphaerochaeta sp.]
MGLMIHQEKITPELRRKLEKLCPFGVITYDGVLSIAMGCKLCKQCVKNSDGAITFQQEKRAEVDKSLWKGVSVLVEQCKGNLHGVTLELLGKAKELASVINEPVYAVVIGSDVKGLGKELASYGADKIFIYDNPALRDFTIEPYAGCLSDFIAKVKPCVIMVGATNIGRSLAPRVAARFHTGLTADCTALEMRKDTDLVQIRPAFGGNIMAMIRTPHTRPQFCTVRYKIFPKPEKKRVHGVAMEMMEVTDAMCTSRCTIIKIAEKPKDIDISEADVIVQCGRGVKSQGDLAIVERLAKIIGAQMACTRPLVESGWFGPKRQIGLSGRTIKSKLLITVGVSGAVQTVAGMKGSDCIIAINKDPFAPIFDVAHYGFVGDLYEIIPGLIAEIERRK